MCTPWTITKLVKKDSATCFLACRFPLDDAPVEDRRRYAAPTPQFTIRNVMAFDYQRNSGGNGRVRNKNMSPSNPSSPRRRPPRHVKETNSSSTSVSVSISTGSASRQVQSQSSNEESSHRRKPSFFGDEDQDYIVFCFKDGALEVMKNVEPEGQNCTSSKHSRQINRKNEGEEGRNRCSKATAAAGSTGEVTEVSIESSDSNQSDCSAASFAFPVLAGDWLGSPVKMPKPEDLDLRKQKARCIRLQFSCCRF